MEWKNRHETSLRRTRANYWPWKTRESCIKGTVASISNISNQQEPKEQKESATQVKGRLVRNPAKNENQDYSLPTYQGLKLG